MELLNLVDRNWNEDAEIYGDYEQSLTRKIIYLAVSKWEYKKSISYHLLWNTLTPSKLNKETLLYIGMNEEKSTVAKIYSLYYC